ncbi:Acyl carrier protein, mitochondrial [Lepraria neglecta]|uniref:Acyl carrier protein n=1 Tax=Lepraria neglecta TaxID=209136 RepID=A0AAD9Z8Q7_9LECA|nr:Acyl carrier protein, mitochondrial [Lepraria neglecta]
MIRAALFQSARCASRSVIRTQLPASRAIAPCLSVPSTCYTPTSRYPGIRCYSAPAGLSKTEVEGRIMDMLKNFDKVKDASKLSNTSHFSNDLGLDSLDTVEVVMAIEEEFSIEIPDKEADGILSSESLD